MLSKARLKFIKSLQVKKYRKQEQCFLIEGAKSVLELLKSDFDVIMVVGTESFLSSVQIPEQIEVIAVSEKELEVIGEFQTNDSAIAVAKQKENLPITLNPNEFALVLDDIRDPGNLGTIIRTADWYGINKIVASLETADCYGSKVITSTMGSFTRTHIYYTALIPFLQKTSLPIYGAFLEGENIHKMNFESGGLIVIGNESRGIDAEVARFVTKKITIPRFGHAESLNAAIATAVICDNLRRSR